MQRSPALHLPLPTLSQALLVPLSLWNSSVFSSPGGGQAKEGTRASSRGGGNSGNSSSRQEGCVMWTEGNWMWALEIPSRSRREEGGDLASHESGKDKITGAGPKSLAPRR